MAKKKKEDPEEVKNIENLAAHAKEFSTGKMIPRKLAMLKLRLVELWTTKVIAEDELTLLKTILTKEMKLGQIEDKFLEVLNRIEQSECEEKCICKVDDAPPVFHVLKDQVCSFRREDQSNIKKAQAGSVYQYVIFIEKIIPPEHQMTKELLLKEERGHHADESMYPKEKIVLHRLQLDDLWFEKIFDVVEDLLSDSKEKDEAFIF